MSIPLSPLPSLLFLPLSPLPLPSSPLPVSPSPLPLPCPSLTTKLTMNRNLFQIGGMFGGDTQGGAMMAGGNLMMQMLGAARDYGSGGPMMMLMDDDMDGEGVDISQMLENPEKKMVHKKFAYKFPTDHFDEDDLE
eukprot:TRINITY_DN3303_c0_g1_i1.p1 TRINITY_DN3303_c0_g1~~TRINITY_DN3303_c0_g1_i1.p1  ORF type:complete len:136 (-),score=23.12 TRINITY_DN3303_c0_g1_i1:280-687(-)